MEYYIKSGEWEQMFEVITGIKHIHKKSEQKLRLFVEAVWYITRSGCQWRLLPRHYGSWRAIHLRFKSWSDKGVWETLFKSLQKDPDMEHAMADATLVRAHACAAGYGKDSQSIEALGRSKGGFTTKIHALVDGLGNPLRFILTAGQRNDITQAENLIEDGGYKTVICDKGYDSDAFVNSIQQKGSIAVIPPRSNRKFQREYDAHIYKERHLIECFFGKIKHFRRIFSRFDKAASTYLAFLNFVGALIWLR